MTKRTKMARSVTVITGGSCLVGGRKSTMLVNR